jgi:hypothetical protein
VFPRRYLTQRRKAAKRCRVSKGFLCGFAPLREINFLLAEVLDGISVLFVQSLYDP